MAVVTVARRGRKLVPFDTSSFRGRFAARLRELRQKRFKRQDDFVDALRLLDGFETITKSTVSGWERGSRVPAIELWPSIAKTLKVKVRSLLPLE